MENSEILLKFIEQRKVSCYKLSQSTGISESTFSKWKSNPTSKIDLSVVQKIAAYFGVSLSDILECNQPCATVPSLSPQEQDLLNNFNQLSEIDKTRVSERAETLAELAAERAAEQEKKAAESVPSSADERPTPQKPLPFPAEPDPEQDEEEKCYIDIFSLPASAGTGVYLDDESKEPIQIVNTDIAERANYAVRVSGNSMIPKYNDGDIVLVETCQCIDVGEIGIFIVNGEGYIKKYGGDRLISLNPKCKNIIFHKGDSVYCRGRVLGVAEVVE